MDKKNFGDLFKKLNQTTDQKWDMGKIKSLAKGFSAKDIKNEDKMRDLIKRVGKSLGMKLSSEKIDKVQEKVNKKLKNR